MEYLVIVRHGAYEESERDGGLIDSGIEQINAIAAKLEARFGQSVHKVCSSGRRRAQQSAEIIANRLGCGFESTDEFNSTWASAKTFQQANQSVCSRGEQTGVLIIVTHFEWGEDFSRFFISNHFDQKIDTPGFCKGDALIINMRDGSLERVRALA